MARLTPGASKWAQGEGWEPATARREDFAFPFGIQAVHVLQPAVLPAQMAALRRGGRVRYVADGAWSDPQSVAVVAGANLPAEAAVWQALLDGSAPLVIPAHTRRQVVLDLEQYVCAYPQMRLSGGSGSRISVGWAEALYPGRVPGRPKGSATRWKGGRLSPCAAM